MRFLADENFPGAAIVALRAEGHDVESVRSEMPGVSDDVVLAHARATARVLLTFDKDFGELVLRRSAVASCGVVLFRLPMGPAAELAGRIAVALAARNDWAGHFSVIEPDRIRMRRLEDAPTH